MYCPNGKILFRTDFTDIYGNINEWECLNEIKNNCASRSNTCELMQMLQSLKTIIERDHHPFYDNLPYSNTQKKRKTV